MIKLTEDYALEWDGYCFRLHHYEKGGKVGVNRRTGEETVSEEGWKQQGKYFNQISHAVKYVANAESVDEGTMYHYLEKYEQLVKQMEKNLEGFNVSNFQRK